MLKSAISRRRFLKGAALTAASASLPAWAQSAADINLTIGPITVELSPKRIVKTTGYNGGAPGPLLRMSEGKPVSVAVTNRSANEEILHWHGLHLPPEIDGAMEEGTPMIGVGATTRYSFTPQQTGIRWYHTHNFAGNDRTKGQYTGQHGLFYVQPKSDPGAYDHEFFLALEDWEPFLMHDDDASMNPAYKYSSINGKMLGFGEPLRVREGERMLLHIVNTSATDFHWIALAGHSLQVIALDGNPVAKPASVPMLYLAPAERVSAIVELKNPGRWVLGEVRKRMREGGMGIVLEYADHRGAPVWNQPKDVQWSYAPFATLSPSNREVIEIPLTFQAVFQGHGSEETWTINGKSYPDTALPNLKAGLRYRLIMKNNSTENHSIHLHRHTFELRKVKGQLMQGVMKDTVVVDASGTVEVEFDADQPGNTLLHCHQQNHMDRGFMALFRYA